MAHYIFRKRKDNRQFLMRITQLRVLSAGALIHVAMLIIAYLALRQGNSSENYEAAATKDISNSLLM